MTSFDVTEIRAQYPALQRKVHGKTAVFLDGPAGAQVPECVVGAVADYMFHSNANGGGSFDTSRTSDSKFDTASEVFSQFYNVEDSDCIVFGPNMTSLAFGFSQALAKTWKAGDEIIVSNLDHDANVSPWVIAAEERGVKVHRIPVDAVDCTLIQQQYEEMLSPQTKLVAVGLASNVTGTVNPVVQMAEKAHAVGALFAVDAVHYAPHGLIDVPALGCDILISSAYKYFGPHVGILWARRDLLEGLQARKVRPASNGIPDRWMQGTPNYEGIQGAAEAVRYLARLGGDIKTENLRDCLVKAFGAIETHERALCERLLSGLQELKHIKVWGITDLERMGERVPTVSMTHASIQAKDMSHRLSELGFFTWSGNHYGLPFTESMGLEPGGTLRVGLLHYNTVEEIDGLLAALKEMG